MTYRRASKRPLLPRRVFHSCFSTVLKAVDAQYDIRGYVLVELVRLCLENRARVPLIHRAHYDRYAQQEAVAFLELFTAHLLFGPAGRFSPCEYHYPPAVNPPSP
ncbi:hypothetical protein ACQKF2_23790 [Pseudomonas hunanensis]|uniref:hypothetical protein n=1 Tax=Pseudomonas hunanensis TaxID=1247546 RepID=UPI003D0542D9